MDHHDKLDWALRHIQKFKEAAAAAIDGDSLYSGVIENYRDPPEILTNTLTFRVVGSIPPDLSLIVGDTVHSLRSSLDGALVNAMKQHLDPTIFEEFHRQIQLPICDSREAYDKAISRRPRRFAVPPLIDAAVESLQPYHTTDPNQLGKLKMLRELSNEDKHRNLVLVGAVTRSARANTVLTRDTTPHMIGYEINWRLIGTPLYDGAKFDYAHFGVTGPDPYAEVQRELSIGIVFAEAPFRGLPVADSLASIESYLRHVVLPALDAL